MQQSAAQVPRGSLGLLDPMTQGYLDQFERQREWKRAPKSESGA